MRPGLLFGHVVGHNHDGAMDDAMKAKRTKTTRDALVEHSGSDYVEDMWLTQAELRTQEESTTINGNDEDDPITILIRDQLGEITSFNIKRSMKLSKTFDVVAKKRGFEIDVLHFLFDGERINGESTAAELELRDMDRIDVLLEASGC